jgi:hypothetical protein
MGPVRQAGRTSPFGDRQARAGGRSARTAHPASSASFPAVSFSRAVQSGQVTLSRDVAIQVDRRPHSETLGCWVRACHSCLAAGSRPVKADLSAWRSRDSATGHRFPEQGLGDGLPRLALLRADRHVAACRAPVVLIAFRAQRVPAVAGVGRARKPDVLSQRVDLRRRLQGGHQLGNVAGLLAVTDRHELRSKGVSHGRPRPAHRWRDGARPRRASSRRRRR